MTMKTCLYTILFCASLGLFAQDETVLIESSANVVFSGDVKLVLDNISLTNEGNLDVTDGEILVSSSTSNFLSTTQSLHLNSLVTGDNNVSLSGEGAFEVSTLTIGGSDHLTFSDTSSLKLTGTVDANGEIIMESGAALWIERTITETALSNVTIERIGPHSSSTGKYSVYGSPVSNAPFSVFGTNAQSWIYEHKESTNDFSSPDETTMQRSQGYFVAFPGDSDGKVTFNGTPYYKNRNFSATRTEVGNDDQEGFNLVANLYTCPIDFETFIEAQTVLEESTIWIWDDYASNTGGSTTDDYLTINYLGSSVTSRNDGLDHWDGTINVAQGFFVKVKNGGGNISFNESMKTLEGNDDASFYRSEPATKYWLSIEDESQKTSSTLLGFVSDATAGRDIKYDASRFGNGFSLYSVLDDRKLAIQGLPTEWLEEGNAISLGYNAPETGSLSISLTHMESSDIDALYLNDHLIQESVNILAENYAFTTAAGSINDRFSISLAPYQNEVLSTFDHTLNIVVYGIENSLVLNSQFTGDFQVFTLNGKLVYEDHLNIGRTDVSLPYGLYIVAVKDKDQVSTYKVKVN